MLDAIYDTIKGLLFYELPKNATGSPVVYNQVIKGWYFGDRSVLSETPGIVIQGKPSSQKDITFACKELTHQITISCWVRADGNALAEKQAMEFTRSVYNALLPHRRMWLMLQCPLCPNLTWSLSPQHYILEHSNIFGLFTDVYDPDNFINNDTYIKKVKYNHNLTWRQTHSNNLDSATAFNRSGLAVEAFYMMCDDVKNNIVVPHLTDASKAKIKSYDEKERIPIAFAYKCVFSDNITPVEQNNDNALFRGGEFTLSLQELRKVSEFGPDNVSTDFWG